MTKYKVEENNGVFKILVYTNVNHTSGVLWWKKSTNSMEWRYADFNGKPIDTSFKNCGSGPGDEETFKLLLDIYIIKYSSLEEATKRIKELRTIELNNKHFKQKTTYHNI